MIKFIPPLNCECEFSTKESPLTWMKCSVIGQNGDVWSLKCEHLISKTNIHGSKEINDQDVMFRSNDVYDINYLSNAIFDTW